MPSLLAFAIAIVAIVSELPAALAQDDDVCASMILDAVDSYGLPLPESAEALGCREVQGRWVMAEVGDSIEYDRDNVESEEDPANIVTERDNLISEIRRMVEDPRIAQVMQYDIGRYIAYVAGPSNTLSEIDMSDESLGGDPLWTHNYRQQYEQATSSFMLDPNNVYLMNYAIWYANRRDSALLGITTNMNPMAGNAFLANWGYGLSPWPWQLADVYTIDTYLNWMSAPQGSAGNSPSDAGNVGCCGAEGGVEPPLFIHFVSADGTLLQGACVRVTAPGYQTETCDNTVGDLAEEAGIVRVNVYPGSYEVQETLPPVDGSLNSDRYEVVVGDEGGSLNIVHDR